MCEDGEERFIVPALVDYNEGTTNYSHLDIERSTSEKGNNFHVINNDDGVSATCPLELSVQSDDTFPTILGNSHHTDFKDDTSINTRYEGNVDEDENQSQSSTLTAKQKQKWEKPSHNSKHYYLFPFLLTLVLATVTLWWKLNESILLNTQLQAELNQTTGLLEEYRVRQEWMLDSKEISKDMTALEIESCWFEASVKIGPCSSDAIGNLKDTYRDFVSYFEDWKANT